MWIICLADDSHEISSYFLWKIKKINFRMSLLQICLVFYQGSYWQVLVKFKDFSSTMAYFQGLVIYIFMLAHLLEKSNCHFNKGYNTNRTVWTFAPSNFVLKSYTKIWNTHAQTTQHLFKITRFSCQKQIQVTFGRKYSKFKYFSRKLSDFQVHFKTKFILKDFSRHPFIFKYFLSLWEPCLWVNSEVLIASPLANTTLSIQNYSYLYIMK